MQYTYKYQSPLGDMILASDGEALIGVWFVDKQRYYGDTMSGERTEKELPIFSLTREWLDSYFRGAAPTFSPSIRFIGSPFRVAVWKILQQIPYGEVITYNDIAKEIARQRGIAKMSAQAVGGAVGHNPVGIIVPCHRVVGTDGSLTGYGGGIDRKVKLLTLEHVNMERLYIPKKGTAL